MAHRPVLVEYSTSSFSALPLPPPLLLVLAPPLVPPLAPPLLAVAESALA
jgi:hypothetical protein